MILNEFQRTHTETPTDFHQVKNEIITLLQHNKYSLSDAKYVFDFIVKYIEEDAIVKEFKE